MSSRSVVKSPTSVDVTPTFELVPLVLMRTWRRSGNDAPVIVRVQKQAPGLGVGVMVGVGVGVGVGGIVAVAVAVGDGDANPPVQL